GRGDELDTARQELREHVDDESLVLTALPDEAAEPAIGGSLHHHASLAGELLVASWWREAARVEQIAPGVEEADRHCPGPCPPAPGQPGPPDRRPEVLAALGRRPAVGQVEQPPRAGELGSPDDVDHQHVEAGGTALEVDHVELMLDVGGPRQRLVSDPHAWVLTLESAKQPGQRIVLAWH